MISYKKALQLLIGFLFLLPSLLFSQDQRMADSLILIYQADTLVGEAKLELLVDLSFNEINDFNLSLKYAEELIKSASELKKDSYLFQGYFQKGTAQRYLGELEKAIDAYFKSAEIANQINADHFVGSAYGAVADIYAISENYDNAMLYYTQAIDALRKSDDTIALASYISNAGDAFLNTAKYDSALTYFQESGELFEALDYDLGKAYSLGNVGLVYANIGRNRTAESNINDAIEILEDYQDYYSISVYLITMSDLYWEKSDISNAINYAQKSLELGEKHGLKDQISDANLKLSELYETSGDMAASLRHYKDYVTYRDSVNNVETVQELADMRTEYEVSQKQLEVDLLNEEKKNQQLIAISSIIALIFFIAFAIGLYRRNRYISKTKAIIEEEKNRSEKLLLNILPEETAQELKEHGKVEAVKFDEVTVLFTDFVKFSAIAEQVDPQQLVKSIDLYFKRFDEIGSKYGLEKIKTIGDSYMTACGLPSPSPEHAKNTVLAAKEMVKAVDEILHIEDGLSHFEIRVGVHTGPVVAGIVGNKKWQYDIWGDTVNIASRMESSSVPGRVNVSETTYQKIKNEFDLEYRGEIEVKNRGQLKMYFLN